MRLRLWFTIATVLVQIISGICRVSCAEAQLLPQRDSLTNAKEGLSIKETDAFPGYSLVAPMNSTSTYLIDMDGRIVNEWKSRFTPALSAYLLENGHLLRPGSEGGFGPGAGGRIQEFDWNGDLVWDYSFGESKLRPHHDICRLPGGNVLVVASDPKTSGEAVAAGRRPETVRGRLLPDCILEIKPTGKTTGDIVWQWHAWDHLVQDFDKSKPNYGDISEHSARIDLNFSTHMMDRMMNDPQMQAQLRSLGYVGGGSSQPHSKGAPGGSLRDAQPRPDSHRDDGKPKDLLPGEQNLSARPEVDQNNRGQDRPGQDRGPDGMAGDWMHVNSVAYNAKLDQVMISVHGFSEVWVIDHSSSTAEAASSTGGRGGKGGDLLYRWGNPRAYRSGSNADQRLFAQHCAHWIDEGLPGAGNLLVFNNGNGRPEGAYSSVDEIVLPLRPTGLYDKEVDLAFGPKRAKWSFAAPNKSSFSSMMISGAQRLPNGNTFICSGSQGILFEVTPANEIVWQFKYPGAGFGGPGRRMRIDRPGELVPEFLQRMLEITASQKESIRRLQGDVDSKLKTVLSVEQQQKMKPHQGVGGPPGPDGVGGPNGRGRGRGGFGPPRVGEIVPEHLIQGLALSDSQAAEVKRIRQEVSAQLAKIWTDEQKERLKEAEDAFAAGPGFGRPGGGFPGFGPPGGGPGPGDDRRSRGGPRGGGPGGIFRSYRYAASYPGLAHRELKPGKHLAEVAAEKKPRSSRRPEDTK